MSVTTLGYSYRKQKENKTKTTFWLCNFPPTNCINPTTWNFSDSSDFWIPIIQDFFQTFFWNNTFFFQTQGYQIGILRLEWSYTHETTCNKQTLSVLLLKNEMKFYWLNDGNTYPFHIFICSKDLLLLHDYNNIVAVALPLSKIWAVPKELHCNWVSI